MKKITNEIKKRIIELYNNGLSGKDIGKEIGFSNVSVYNTLKKEKIVIRQTTNSNKKYSFNKSFFDSIDTEEKAYWLGFFYADGYNDEKTGLIKIVLHEKDIDILEKLLLCIDGNQEIKTERNIYKKICISNKKISNRMAELGAPQCKSNKIVFPTFLSKDLIRHFIRGYFDGDGCVCLTNHGKAAAKFECNNIFGIELMNFLISNKVIEKYGISTRREGCISSSFYIQGGHFSCMKFLEYIYKNSNIYCNRKYNRYIEYKQIKCNY